MTTLQILRGDVVRVALSPTKGREIRRAARPCIVVQNDIGNQYSHLTIVVPLTDADDRSPFPFQVHITKGDGGLAKDSIALCEQIRVIDKQRIVKNIGALAIATVEELDRALCNSLAL